MTDVLIQNRNDPSLTAAGVVVVVGLATIGGFLFFEHVMGLPPCPLCLEQRIAFYVAVPLAALLWLGAGHGTSRKVLMLGFAAIAVAMLWNAGLGVYHSGIEWKFWPGPQDCSGQISRFGSPEDLMKQLQGTALVRCDQAAWRFLGLSLAGWNVLVSLGLAVVAAWGARGAYRTRQIDDER
jgi:disulfide bond formation protein DsbB